MIEGAIKIVDTESAKNILMFSIHVDEDLCASITCFEEIKETINFKWTKLGLENFEEIHGFSRILLLIPDKCATAIKINKEFLSPPDSGEFLLQLVQNLLLFYIEKSKKRIIPSLIDSLQDLHADCETFIDALNVWRPEHELITLAHSILDKCELFRAAVSLYLNYLHPELLAIQRCQRRRENHKSLLETASEEILAQRQKLKNEFITLLSSTG